MSFFAQLLIVFSFLSYSAIYLLFVAWASERATCPDKVRPNLAWLLPGVLPALVILSTLFWQLH